LLLKNLAETTALPKNYGGIYISIPNHLLKKRCLAVSGKAALF
jgi:hypothetical protein